MIADFLIKVHKPLERVAWQAPSSHRVEELQPTYKAKPATSIGKVPDSNSGRDLKTANKQPSLLSNRCKYCQSTRLEAKYGQYGYYFSCRDCNKNAPIKFACAACGGDGRLRKQGDNFYAECKVCSESKLFHINSTS